MIIVIYSCQGENQDDAICGSLSGLVFITRCGLNLAFCFIFVIHTELFPTFFLATSYGLCSFVGRSLTLAAPIIAESQNKALPLGALALSSLMGMIGCLMIKQVT